MNKKKKRIFIAFPVSKEVQDELIKIQNNLKEQNRDQKARWTNPDNFHVTLQFIGEMDEAEIERLKKVLQDLSMRHEPVKLWLDRINAFPNKNNPAVLHMVVAEERIEARKLQKDLVDNLMAEKFISKIHPWKPHITIARNKSKNFVSGLDSINFEKVIFEVGEINLIESILRADGAEYRLIEKYKCKTTG